MNIPFDPCHEHYYLIERAKRAGNTLTRSEKVALLMRLYGVNKEIARRAVDHKN